MRICREPDMDNGMTGEEEHCNVVSSGHETTSSHDFSAYVLYSRTAPEMISPESVAYLLMAVHPGSQSITCIPGSPGSNKPRKSSLPRDRKPARWYRRYPWEVDLTSTGTLSRIAWSNPHCRACVPNLRRWNRGWMYIALISQRSGNSSVGSTGGGC